MKKRLQPILTRIRNEWFFWKIRKQLKKNSARPMPASTALLQSGFNCRCASIPVATRDQSDIFRDHLVTAGLFLTNGAGQALTPTIPPSRMPKLLS